MFPFNHYPLVNVPLIAGGGPPGPLPPALVFDSQYTGTNGTSIHGFVPDLGDAFAVTGTMEIQSNKAVVTSSAADAIATTDYGSGELEFEFELGAANANQAASGIVHGTTADRYLLAYYSGDGNLQLYRRSLAVFTLLSTTTWTADTSAHVGKVTFYENEIKVYLDGVLKITYSMNESLDPFGTMIGVRGFKTGSDADKFNYITLTVPGELEWQNYPGELVAGFTDDFGDANGTSLLTTGWDAQFGVWTTESAHAENATTAGANSGYTVVYNSGQTDHGAEVAALTPATSDFIPGVAFAWVDSDNFIEWEVNNRPSYSGPGGSGMWWYDGVVFHPVVTKYLVPANATTYTLRAWRRGDYCFGEVVEAGIRVAAKCTQFPSATRVGLFEANNAGLGILGNDFDNLTIIS